MKKYAVVVTSFGELSCTLEVEADSEEEEAEQALASDDFDWDIVEHEQHRSVEQVERAE